MSFPSATIEKDTYVGPDCEPVPRRTPRPCAPGRRAGYMRPWYTVCEGGWDRFCLEWEGEERELASTSNGLSGTSCTLQKIYKVFEALRPQVAREPVRVQDLGDRPAKADDVDRTTEHATLPELVLRTNAQSMQSTDDVRGQPEPR